VYGLFNQLQPIGIQSEYESRNIGLGPRNTTRHCRRAIDDVGRQPMSAKIMEISALLTHAPICRPTKITSKHRRETSANNVGTRVTRPDKKNVKMSTDIVGRQRPRKHSPDGANKAWSGSPTFDNFCGCAASLFLLSLSFLPLLFLSFFISASSPGHDQRIWESA